EEDAATVVTWFNDPEVNIYLRRHLPMTLTEEKRFLEANAGNTTDLVVAMVHRETDRLIGVTGLHGVDIRNRHAQFGITIGDKNFWNQGVGTEATRLIVRHAFETLNLNKVWLHVYEYNPRAVHVYEKIGFRVEGRLRQDQFRQGRYWDTIVMGLLREEYAA